MPSNQEMLEANGMYQIPTTPEEAARQGEAGAAMYAEWQAQQVAVAEAVARAPATAAAIVAQLTSPNGWRVIADGEEVPLMGDFDAHASADAEEEEEEEERDGDWGTEPCGCGDCNECNERCNLPQDFRHRFPSDTAGTHGQRPVEVDGRRRMGYEIECNCEEPTYLTGIYNSNDACGLSPTGRHGRLTYLTFHDDGSITGEDPVEFVSEPFTVAEHASILHAVAAEYAVMKTHIGGGKIRRSWGNTSCGMHVHVGRHRLSQLTVGKLWVFMNDPTNRMWLDEMAGRRSNGYCQTSGDAKLTHKNSDRYTALNLHNHDTIEFRLFRSTTRITSVLKNLELCESLCDWAEYSSFSGTMRRERRTNPNARRALSWSEFYAWLALPGNRKGYPRLMQWILARPSSVFSVHMATLLPKNVLATLRKAAAAGGYGLNN